MSPRPGYDVTRVASAAARGTEVDISTAFMVGFADRGILNTPVLHRSLADYIVARGERTASTSNLYDAVEMAFRHGAAKVYTVRTAGPAPVYATANIFDQADSVAPGDVALVVTAIEPGTWANGLNYAVTVDGSNFSIAITHDTDTTVSEASGTLADRAAAVAWGLTSDYVRITLGASNEDPRAGTGSLAGGDDDYADATDATWETSINSFPRDLGPGQICTPGRTTAAAYASLGEHAAANNRVVVFDAVDSATPATAYAPAASIRSADVNASYGAAFGPWLTVPGVTASTTRTVAPSGIICGLIAKSDRAGNSPNRAAAGTNGFSALVDALTQTYTDAQRTTLYAAGVNPFKIINEQARVFGFDSLADPDTEPAWKDFAGSRLVMLVQAQVEAIAEDMLFREIDGQGIMIGQFGARIRAVLEPLYLANSLYGAESAEAYIVDVGAAVNTPETIAAGELHASILLRTSPTADYIPVTIMKSRADLPLAA